MDGSPNPEDLRAFLLRRLPEEDASLMEERLIVDQDFFHDVQNAEDELVDECALGTLNPAEEQDFLQVLRQQPSLAERLAVRRAFFAALTSQSQQPIKTPAPARRGVRWLLVPGIAFAASLLVVASLFLFRANRHLEVRLAQLEKDHAAPAPQPPPSLPALPAASGAVATLFFPAHASRGVGAQSPLLVSVSPSRLLELQLEIPAEASQVQRWTLSIQNKQSTQLLQNDLKKQQIGSVTFARAYIYTSTLEPGKYSVLLSSRNAADPDHRMDWTLVVTR